MSPRMKVFGLAAAIGLSPLLSACHESGLYGMDATHPAVATPDPVAARLSEAADKAANALQSLAAVEQARTPTPLPAISPAAPGDELQRPITVAWNGPAAPLLERLAARTGYRLNVLGSNPAVPVVVNIDAGERPVLEILRNVGLQMGHRANLVVDGNRHVFELDYATHAP